MKHYHSQVFQVFVWKYSHWTGYRYWIRWALRLHVIYQLYIPFQCLFISHLTTIKVSGSFYLFMATPGCLNNPIFSNLGYVLHVEQISCVITNCGQHQWAIPFLFPIVLEALLEEYITRKLLSLFLDLFFKMLLFQDTFLIFFSIAILSSSYLQVGLLL